MVNLFSGDIEVEHWLNIPPSITVFTGNNISSENFLGKLIVTLYPLAHFNFEIKKFLRQWKPSSFIYYNFQGEGESFALFWLIQIIK